MPQLEQTLYVSFIESPIQNSGRQNKGRTTNMTQPPVDTLDLVIGGRSVWQ